MGSLAHCMKKHKVDDVTAMILRNKVNELKDEGYTHQEASTQAVQDYRDELRAEREDVLSQAKAAADEAARPSRKTTRKITIAAAPGNNATWIAPEPSKLDNVIHSIQDKLIDTKRVVQAITKTSQAIHDSVDVYLQEELYHGRAAKRTQDFLDRELKPLIVDMAARKIKIDDFEEYLHNRHAEERNAQIAKINPAMPDGGSGIMTADARAYMAGLAQPTRLAYEALARRVDAINQATSALKVAGRLESQSTIDAWNAAYKNYVPLQREDMDGITHAGTGQGFSVKGKSKRAMGSSRGVENILGNIAMERERTIVRVEKNRVANGLVALAALNPNKDFWNVDAPPKIKFIGTDGLVQETVDPMFKSRDNVVVARMQDAKGDIVERAVVFNPRNERAVRMAMSLKNLDAEQLHGIVKFGAGLTRYFAAINTQYNPIFGVANLVRDTQAAFLNLTSTPIAGKQGKVLWRTIPALIGIMSDLRRARGGQAGNSSTSAAYEEMQQHGGMTGYRDIFNTSTDRADAIKKELERAGKSGPRRLMPETLRYLADLLSDYNTAMENSTRLAVYETARQQGLTPARAASLSKNSTVNFNRKGANVANVGAMYAFFNASMQGTARIAETMLGPKGAMIATGGIMFGVLQALAIAAGGFGDDEPPEFVRQRNIIIPIGNKKYLTIPMPLGFHILPNMGRIPAEYVLSGMRKPGERVRSMIALTLDAFNPVGGGSSVAQTLTPTVLDPVMALSENMDWTGKEIARQDRDALNPTPGHTRAKDVSSGAGKWASHAFNAASGGTEYQPGAFSPTPDQIDYIIGQVTGGVGRELQKLGTTLGALQSGEEIPTHKIPLVGRFYGNANDQSGASTGFYENVKEINGHELEIKGRKAAGEEYGSYMEDNPTASLVKEGNDAEKKVSKLRKEKRAALAEGADRSEIKDIEDRITETMTDFNALVKDTRGN